MNVARVATITALLVLTSAGGFADMIVAKGLPHYGAKITDVADCSIVFRMGMGARKQITKPLAEVTSVAVDGQVALNEAEELLEAKKFPEAVAAYDDAARANPAGWMGRLVRCRRLRALDQGGMIAQSVSAWLEIVDRNDASANSLSLHPTKLAARGSGENVRATALLEGKLERIGESKPYETAVKRLLLELYDFEGQREKAARLAGEIAASTTGPSEKATRPSNGTGRVRVPSGNVAAQLRAFDILLNQGQAEKVAKQIQGNLHFYKPADLSTALLLLGRAQLALQESAEGQDRRLLLGAGLNLMRVATLFKESPEAPEALFLAGRANFLLSNLSAAGKAYQEVIRLYPENKFSGKAREALDSLKQQERQ